MRQTSVWSAYELCAVIRRMDGTPIEQLPLIVVDQHISHSLHSELTDCDPQAFDNAQTIVLKCFFFNVPLF